MLQEHYGSILQFKADLRSHAHVSLKYVDRGTLEACAYTLISGMTRLAKFKNFATRDLKDSFASSESGAPSRDLKDSFASSESGAPSAKESVANFFVENVFVVENFFVENTQFTSVVVAIVKFRRFLSELSPQVVADFFVEDVLSKTFLSKTFSSKNCSGTH